MDKEKYQEEIAKSVAIGIVNSKCDYANYPERLRPIVQRMRDKWYFRPPQGKGKNFAFWIQSCDEILDACAEFGVDLLDAVSEDWEAHLDANQGHPPYLISSPKSLVTAVQGKARLWRSGDRETSIFIVRGQPQKRPMLDV